MSNYARNKAASRTKTTMPTATDQAAAHDTDRNIIMTRYMVHGQAPGTAVAPRFGDFTRLPTDLRGFLDQARGLAQLRRKLPKELQNMSTDELTRLTPEELKKILTPPAPPPATKEGDAK